MSKYPFDIQHRQIIRYLVESKRDYATLKSKITERLQSILKQQAARASIPAITRERTVSSGLPEYEIACLAAIGLELGGLETSVSNFRIRSEMEKLGFNNLAVLVALRNLRSDGMIVGTVAHDNEGDPFECYGITEDGWDWINRNIKSLNLKHEKSSKRRFDVSVDDEIPF